MPLYTYTCSDHGEFSAWGRMATSEEPQPCPSCAAPAPRALARPAIGSRADAAAGAMAACGEGMCAPIGPGAGMGGGGCCGGGACVH